VRALLVTLSVLVAGALGLAPTALADDGVSSNWAGYAAHGASFHSVSASWREPGVTCARGQTTYSAYWVGLGGYRAGSNALEQIGTEADCQGGRAVQSAWFEMVPAASMPVYIPVNAGDALTASVAVSGHRATLVLDNVTRHRTYRTTVSSGPIDTSSAEWIVEAPSDCLSTCTTLPLANFGSAQFTGARAQLASGYAGGINDHHWSTTRIRLAPAARQFVGSHLLGGASAATLSWGGSVFSVSYTSVGASYLVLRRHVVGSGRFVHPLRTGGLSSFAATPHRG
jgi:Peptidase A4 family